jgi:hypothetical protein
MVTGLTRFGQRTGEAAASFRCGACREIAAVVKAVRAGTAADMGPPLGRQAYDRDGIVVDYFLGTAWKRANPATYAGVRAILSQEAPDPAELRQLDWELAPFYCPDCGQNYCRADWHTYVLDDEGLYDCTMGICPGGHRYMVDD